MNRKDRRTLKSIERRARRALTTVRQARHDSPGVRRAMAHVLRLHNEAVDKGLTTEPD